MRRATILAAALIWCAPAAANDTLVPKGSIWNYLDDGSNQGTAWQGVGFDDSSWTPGQAELGYGDGTETTLVGFGPDPSNKFVTTYFRHEFQVVDATQYVSQTLKLQRDDGAVVYLNGVEIARSNLPTGSITYTTLANKAINAKSEKVLEPFILEPTLLVTGTNVLTVEVHLKAVTSPDMSFDLELVGNTTFGVIRGPYLQRGTPTEVVVRWRTDAFTDARVLIGPDPNSLGTTFADATIGFDHEVEITGLIADTTYYYSVGTGTTELAGADADHFFITPPAVGTTDPARFWVLGDSGTGNANAAAVRDAYYNFTGTQHTDLWLMLGDNAYYSGTDGEYQIAVFDMYPEMLRKSVLWPTRGNHEMFASRYYDLFTLPDCAQAGGLKSGTEAYYAFDWANVHFICLDSQGSSRSKTGPMAVWLQADLASTLQDWIIAFWHHPPYSKGSHDSDLEAILIEMRENMVPFLEAGGVDLVLSGHSHSYERSFLLNGHHGFSSTLTPQMVLDNGDGRETGTGAYNKGVSGKGAVYTVAGSSGKTTPAPLNMNSMFISVEELGSVVVDVDGSRLDVTFLDDIGAVVDWFTLLGPGYTGTYCVSKTSSAGCLPSMSLSGTPSATLPALFLANATGVDAQKSGLVFYGFSPLGASFQGGRKCVAAPTRRTPLQGSGGVGACDGSYTYDFNARIQSGVDPALVPGATVYSQYWYRDPQSASTTGLSDAAQWVIEP